ncbi:MAG: sulfotransferase [Porticoccaceae bacterium]|nr:sulfotransferase [Porticoccaceae bacterium]
MGDDLNGANDNLIFTRLFKNPSWFESARKEEITARLDVFKDYMEKDQLDINSALILIKSSITNLTFSQNGKRAKNIIRKVLSPPQERSIWGWKEPNTQIYIQEISDYFPHLKYIHIVRHGLDMAFSNNKQQLKNWGYKYGIHLDGKETENEVSYKQMEYWMRSTEGAIHKGQT